MKSASRGVWAVECALLAIPLAAIFHHAVFFRPTCMLNPFGPEYTPHVLAVWLASDPSLPLALLAAAGVFVLGLRPKLVAIRSWVPAFVIAFVPLSLWIWDVPFAGRPICTCCHDGRWIVPVLGAVRTKHMYALGLLTFVGLSFVRIWLDRARKRAATVA
jgi:hypothetical protein